MTQTSLAVVMDVSLRAVQKWTAGDTSPNADRLRQLAALFNKEPGWFYVDHDPDAQKVAA